ncbi:MAG: hypothetical protein OJF52_003764 [Nitrospira sp.]|nr:MAG: hypothetical protein OJF52_003764 [Nitrospira sp.]
MGRLATARICVSGEARHAKFYVPARSTHMDLIYLTIAAIFFLLSGWLISALDRL